jgi:hypothetical protein
MGLRGKLRRLEDRAQAIAAQREKKTKSSSASVPS